MEIDLNEEMRKEPEERKPGTMQALIKAALEWGRDNEGADVQDLIDEPNKED